MRIRAAVARALYYDIKTLTAHDVACQCVFRSSDTTPEMAMISQHPEGMNVHQKEQVPRRQEPPHVREFEQAGGDESGEVSSTDGKLVGAEIGGKGRHKARSKNYTRAANSGIRLTEQDASLIKGMLAAKAENGAPQYRQADIAAFFCVNPGRIIEIKTGRKFKDVVPTPAHALPPPGPYVVVPRISHDTAVVAKNMLDRVLEEITQVVTRTKRDLGKEASRG